MNDVARIESIWSARARKNQSKDRFLARRPVQQQRQLERGNNCRFQRSTRRQTVDHIEQ